MRKRSVLAFLLLTMVVSLAGMSANALDLTSLAPFLYQGSNYVPLKSTASFLGAPLRWDADTGRAIMTYNGQDLAFTPNSRNATYDGRPVVLDSRPIVVNGVTYVPVSTLKRYYNVPVEWDRNRSEIKMKGPDGWRTMKARSRPPWHGGPPPWAPAWGQRGNSTPGHSSYGNRSAYEQQRYGKNQKSKAWKKSGYDAKGNSKNKKMDGKGKSKGNRDDD